MSDPRDHTGDDDRSFLALDHALGALGAADRAQAERRMRTDAEFRREVEGWQHLLAPLAAEVADVAPRPELWRGIEQTLAATRARVGERTPSRASGSVHPFWRWLAIGNGGLALASLCALLLLGMPLDTQNVSGGGGTFSASTITSDADGVPLFAVVLDPAANTATLVPIRLAPTEGRVPELWIARDGGAPRSLGTFRAGEPLRLVVDADAIHGDLSGSLLAISLEPPGGSPTGRPTGPVLGHGSLSTL